MLIKEIMSRDVITIPSDASLQDVGRTLKEKRISGVPIVNDNGSIVGIITVTDLLRILGQIYQWKIIETEIPELKLSEIFEKEKSKAKVRDVMTKNVFTLKEDDTINDVFRMMFKKKIHTIPITKDGKLVGIVGKRDIVYSCF